MGYKYSLDESDLPEGRTLDQIDDDLETFLTSLYYGNDAYWEIRFALLHCAFKDVGLPKLVIEVGKGEDGKGAEWKLEKGVTNLVAILLRPYEAWFFEQSVS